ncbi:hypothetical protein [Streptosporangium sp. NPDC000396]|uniref:hypothetical protein n=1 Tax=Streptosporangium sp. NPDC000396 TaxID=3366185 RepID=UPI00369C6E82
MGVGESLMATAELDLRTLRRYRARPGMGNLPARATPALWTREYGRHEEEQPDELGDTVPEMAWFSQRQRATIEQLRKAGVIM